MAKRQVAAKKDETAGERVCVLDDLSTGKRENLPQHAALEFIEGDIRDAGQVEGYLG